MGPNEGDTRSLDISSCTYAHGPFSTRARVVG